MWHEKWVGGVMIGLVAMLWGCTHPGPTLPLSGYKDALAATDSAEVDLMEAGTATEAQAIAAFKNLWSDFTAERLRGNVVTVYADDAYFRDTFVELHTAQDLENYLVRSAEATRYCTFAIEHVATANGDYYFRWTMELQLERYARRPPDSSKGMSHIRFDPDGRVIFHVDYWDAGTLYEQFPLIGPSIRWVKRRLAG